MSPGSADIILGHLWQAHAETAQESGELSFYPIFVVFCICLILWSFLAKVVF